MALTENREAELVAQSNKYRVSSKPASKPPMLKGSVYTCPMHPQIRRW